MIKNRYYEQMPYVETLKKKEYIYIIEAVWILVNNINI